MMADVYLIGHPAHTLTLCYPAAKSGNIRFVAIAGMHTSTGSPSSTSPKEQVALKSCMISYQLAMPSALVDHATTSVLLRPSTIDLSPVASASQQSCR